MHQIHAVAIRAGRGSLTEEQCAAAVAVLHQRFRDESQRLTAQRSKEMQDVLAREGKRLQGSLSAFLSTPLRSDAAEVSEILNEALRRVLPDGLGRDNPAGLAVSTARYSVPHARKAKDKELCTQGSAMLRELCGAAAKGDEPMMETMFRAAGEHGSAVLEELLAVRGLLPHEFRVRDTAALRLIAEQGVPAAPGNARALAVWFRVDDQEHDGTLADLGTLLRPWVDTTVVRHSALWQRRSGVTTWGYELHGLLSDAGDPGDALDWLNSRQEFLQVLSGGTAHTGVLLKEFYP